MEGHRLCKVQDRPSQLSRGGGPQPTAHLVRPKALVNGRPAFPHRLLLEQRPSISILHQDAGSSQACPAMPYRLALDIGANSIGWALLNLDSAGRPCGLRDLGVRVFPDGRNPKDKSSLAVARRQARAMRRRRDRYLQRRAALLNALTRFGLMPVGEAERRAVAQLDPYALRADALHRRLEPAELGRVIFHLNQRRGFRSNRKTDRSNEERSKIREAGDRLRAELTRGGYPTLGAFLAERHARRAGVRARLQGSGAAAYYPFYPTRDLVAAEFDAIWAAQAQWNPMLTEAARDTLRGILLHQRPLKPVPVGRCWLEPGMERAARALPTVQAFRIAQDLAHLAIRMPGQPDQRLSDKQRSVLRAALEAGRDLSFDRIRKMLGLVNGETFNLESAARDKLKGAETASRLAGSKGPWRDIWTKLDEATRDAAVTVLLEAEDDAEAVAELVRLGVPETAAEAALGITLPEGHAALSLKAMRAILPCLRAGRRYSDAVQDAGYAHHSDDRDSEILPALPYYGEVLAERLGTGTGVETDPPERRYGRAPNPTVHVALNQLRQVVNALIRHHGQPAQIVVEVLRDLGRSAFERSQEERRQAENAKANERRKQILRDYGQAVNRRNLAFLRLWEEQAKDPKDRICPYTGELIGITRLFSGEVEEDHILPFALTLDDSFANRVLVLREANRRKARRTPHEAFGHTAEWSAILERIKVLPEAKRWRFAPDALERWKGENADFLARHLTDSAYLARLARRYLQAVCDRDQVWAIPGRLTALLRDKLGLNSLLGAGGKNRADHRHHAVDALVVGLCDRGLLQRVTTAAKRAEEEGRRLLAALPEPWLGFHAEAAAAVARIVVSHKQDTGPQGRLLKETAYGPVEGREDGRNVRVRQPIEKLADWQPSDRPKKGQALIADPELRRRIDAVLTLPDLKERRAALANFHDAAGHQVRRVRTLERQSLLVPLRDQRNGRIYKLQAPGENHCMEIWREPDGTLVPISVTLFDAATGRVPKRHPAARRMLRLHKNDVVAFGVGEARRLFLVKQVWEGLVVLTDLRVAAAEDFPDRDIARPIYARPHRFRQEAARKVKIDPTGHVLDPGPLPW